VHFVGLFLSLSISKPTTFLARQGHESGVMSADSSWQNIFDETDGEFLEPLPTYTN
jgi:putative methionine-R-sulfoxide reductase with GAF domain